MFDVERRVGSCTWKIRDIDVRFFDGCVPFFDGMVFLKRKKMDILVIDRK